MSDTPASPNGPKNVIERLLEVDAGLNPGDGVRSFNTLYLAVARAISETEFEDPEALKLLETNFVDLYLEALDADTSAPRSWKPLFEARFQAGILPLQFALAGMNAHINRDLPVALVKTWAELEIKPWTRSAFRRDYEAMNSLLAEVEERMRPELIPEEFQRLPNEMARLADLLAAWKIEMAREAAWGSGMTLRVAQRFEDLDQAVLNELDGAFGVVSHNLLRPI